jgi:hypothetical protein
MPPQNKTTKPDGPVRWTGLLSYQSGHKEHYIESPTTICFDYSLLVMAECKEFYAARSNSTTCNRRSGPGPLAAMIMMGQPDSSKLWNMDSKRSPMRIDTKNRNPHRPRSDHDHGSIRQSPHRRWLSAGQNEDFFERPSHCSRQLAASR